MKSQDTLFYGIKAGLPSCLIKDLLTAFIELIFKGQTNILGLWRVSRFSEYSYFDGHSNHWRIDGSFFGGFLAIFYTHVKRSIQTRNPLWRGFIFGGAVWYSTRCLITMDHVKVLIAHQLFMVPVNVLIAATYGWVVSYVLEKLEKRDLKNE